MNQKYEKWINAFQKENPKTRGLCTTATLSMVKKFPELTRVRGHVEDALCLKPIEHWWCVDSEDNIIDPTATQFSVILSYTKRNENLREPTGKCPNCGNYCYNNHFCCCNKCEREYASYLSKERF